MLLSSSALIVTKTVFVCGAALIKDAPVTLLPTLAVPLTGLLVVLLEPPKELLLKRFPDVFCLCDCMLGLAGALSPYIVSRLNVLSA